MARSVAHIDDAGDRALGVFTGGFGFDETTNINSSWRYQTELPNSLGILTDSDGMASVAFRTNTSQPVRVLVTAGGNGILSAELLLAALSLLRPSSVDHFVMRLVTDGVFLSAEKIWFVA